MSLQGSDKLIAHRVNSFEVFGIDFMIDTNYKVFHCFCKGNTTCYLANCILADLTGGPVKSNVRESEM